MISTVFRGFFFFLNRIPFHSVTEYMRVLYIILTNKYKWDCVRNKYIPIGDCVYQLPIHIEPGRERIFEKQ